MHLEPHKIHPSSNLLAAHIISTSYMTWPPGDPRGHWSPLFDTYGHLIQKGHRLRLPDTTTLHHATQLAKSPQLQRTSNHFGSLRRTSHPYPRQAGGYLLCRRARAHPHAPPLTTSKGFAWQNTARQVWLSANTRDYLQHHHNIPANPLPSLDALENLLKATASSS